MGDDLKELLERLDLRGLEPGDEALIAEALRAQRAEIKQLKEKLIATEGLFRGANSMALRRDGRQAEAGRQSMDQSRRAILTDQED